MERLRKTGCIFNYAPHYRLAIYLRLHSALNADFYFGANLANGEVIRKIDLNCLPGFQKEFKVHKAGPFKWSFGWLRTALSTKYDRFLITQDLYAVNQWFFLVACKLLGKPVYVWTHGLRQNPANGTKGSRTTDFLRHWEDRYIAGYFLYGDRAKENMWLAGFDAEKLHVVYNSLDYDNIRALRGTVPANPYTEIFGNAHPVVVFIGRLTKVKRLDMVIEAVERLLDKGTKVNVAFLGDGPEMEALKKSIKDCHEGHFHFAGAVYDTGTIHSYLYHGSVCLSPGNVGLTAITCLSEGLPVITHDNMDEQMPEAEAIMPGQTGDFFRQGDLDDLERKTSLWLEKLSSPEQRDDIRMECHKIIDRKYNPEYQARTFKEVIG